MNWDKGLPQHVAAPATLPNAERGAVLFRQGVSQAPPCVGCHTVQAGLFSLGPSLAGIAERAGQRVAGQAAETYLRQSILEPKVYVVAGYRNLMYADFGDYLSESDVADIIAYLLTL